MSLSTSVSAIDNTGTVFVYIPPNVVAIPRGFSVSYGTYQPYAAGDILAPSGIVQLANGSGSLLAVDQVTVRTVTITAPTTQPAEKEQPQGDIP